MFFSFQDIKDEVDFKMYDVTTWLTVIHIQIIVIHILTNISRSKGNKTMQFDQLIDYNMKIIFLKRS